MTSKPRIARFLTAEALMAAARWPNASPRTVVSLIGQLAATRRYDEAYAFFDELPGHPLLLAAAGFFQARLDGQLTDAIDKLDKAVAAGPGLPNYFRGTVLAQLPVEHGRTDDAIADLELVVALPDRFPVGLRRAALRALADAYRLAGRTEDSAAALDKAGLPDQPALTTDYWMTEQDGFRFTLPTLRQLADKVFVAQGYDFADIAFVVTESSLVVIDAGSTEENTRAALRAVRAETTLPISHVILTHGHFDHVGGLNALLGPGVEVIAQSGLAEEVEHQNDLPLQWKRFMPAGADHRVQAVPDRLVAEPQTLTIGGVDFRLIPVRGGETDDALLVHLPGRDVTFVGDVLMPYLGAPFFAEGSAEGLIDTLRIIEELRPRVLVHGHPTLTANFTVDVIPALRAAFDDLYQVIRADIRAGATVLDILDRNHLPEVLRANPDAVLPYLLMRDNMIRRVQRQRTGYWQPDIDSIDPVTPTEWAGVLDLLTGGEEATYTRVIQDLLDRDDLPPALRLADLALRNNPASGRIAELRREALLRLVERNQALAPFKFIVYSELAGLTVPAFQD
ncbi:MBL fold metallo-hydrolase [Kutzneria sp. CA-103260]|uniref:MBL fold metallo-hydrolase n=1 Tax=Kutzneria sp. CA-103260 TaxID=2802641 RepID=UPI001BAA1621|nr:MBL fold metallo-hydrolase [Kutzneria sp. CA-103260]QUQ65594.1 Hydroxyacylglutathione hydrolase [Kutzneria sp. CA-103260]